MSYLVRSTLALFITFLLTSCSTLTGPLKQPEVNLAGISIVEFGLIEQQFDLTLRVTNPNSFDLPVEGMQLNLALNGAPFAKGITNQVPRLKGMSDTRVTLRVSTNLGQALKQFRSLLTSKSSPQYQLNGELYLPLVPGGLPFSRSGEVSLGSLLP